MSFEDLIKEILKEVHHLEPWAEGCARLPSSAYCILLKLFLIRLTESEIYNMLGYRGNAYVRGMGILYLRYGCKSDEIWSWIGHYIDDEESISISWNKEKKTTIGNFIKDIMCNTKYFDTILPRIPIKYEREVKANIYKHEIIKKRNINNVEKYKDKIEIGSKVKCVYSMDCEWYEGRVIGIREISNTYKICYDEYNNEEYRSIYMIKLINEENSDDDGNENSYYNNNEERKYNKHHHHRNHINYNSDSNSDSYNSKNSDDDDEDEDVDILKRIKEEERSQVIAQGKNYADKVGSTKRNLILPFDRYTARSRSRSRTPPPVMREKYK